jgi:ssDNA-binding Zn-finger/Zn-ribbon topoisomerase 1
MRPSWDKKDVRDRDVAPRIPKSLRPKCPGCARSMMVRRSKKLTLFWGCRAFPACMGTVNVPEATLIALVRAHGPI